MGIQERKMREKEAFKKLIIATAHDLLIKQGLDGITMRAIANTLEYSQSKIYEFFTSKDELCEVLFEELITKLFEITKKIPKTLSPDEYLTQLLLKTVEFHTSYPHSEALFTLICYGPKRFEMPEVFHELEQYPITALKNLNSPYLKTDQQIYEALDMTRAIKTGIAAMMASESSFEGRKRIAAIADNIIKVLLRGWK